MAQIIDGKKIAADVRAQVAAEVQRLVSENGLKPGLAVVLVGEGRWAPEVVHGRGVGHAAPSARCRRN